MPKLKRNILNFGYRLNFKHKGMLSHSFDRFYVVAKFELPKVEDLKLTTIDFDSNCSYLDGSGNYLRKLLRHYGIWIFSGTEKYFKQRDKLSPVFKHGFLRSKENVDIKNIMYTKVYQKICFL